MDRYTELVLKYEELEKKLYRLKTQKAKQKVRDQLLPLRHEIHDILLESCKKYEGKTVKAVVKFFHKYDGTVYLRCDEWDCDFYSNACNDVLSKSWYGETCCVEYEKGQEIELIIGTEIRDNQICRYVKKIKGGKLNKKVYKELCKNKDRAFFIYPNAKGVTGLFK